MNLPTKRIIGRKVTSSHGEQVLDLLQKTGIARSRDFVRGGVTRAALQRQLAIGSVERVSRGLYTLAGSDFGEKQTLIEATLKVPSGIICLLSALQFHGLTTQNPASVWLAIAGKARTPASDGGIPLRIVRFSGPSLKTGIDEHPFHGVKLRVYNPAKTVADCFKFRHLVGHDVALEALRGCRRNRKVTIDQIWEAAKIDRVANLIRPYLEALA